MSVVDELLESRGIRAPSRRKSTTLWNLWTNHQLLFTPNHPHHHPHRPKHHHPRRDCGGFAYKLATSRSAKNKKGHSPLPQKLHHEPPPSLRPSYLFFCLSFSSVHDVTLKVMASMDAAVKKEKEKEMGAHLYTGGRLVTGAQWVGRPAGLTHCTSLRG